MTFAEQKDGILTFDRIDVAKTFGSRLIGLMGRTHIPSGYCLVFPHASSVHTCFMRVPIDVLYLDGADNVLGGETLGPWKLGHAPAGTKTVVECAAASVAVLPKKVEWRSLSAVRER